MIYIKFNRYQIYWLKDKRVNTYSSFNIIRKRPIKTVTYNLQSDRHEDGTFTDLVKSFSLNKSFDEYSVIELNYCNY